MSPPEKLKTQSANDGCGDDGCGDDGRTDKGNTICPFHHSLNGLGRKNNHIFTISIEIEVLLLSY